ncbi:hypothetical protein BC567DRAFT_214771, partial [Phyllosticta citribraziliensis]
MWSRPENKHSSPISPRSSTFNLASQPVLHPIHTTKCRPFHLVANLTHRIGQMDRGADDLDPGRASVFLPQVSRRACKSQPPDVWTL